MYGLKPKTIEASIVGMASSNHYPSKMDLILDSEQGVINIEYT